MDYPHHTPDSRKNKHLNAYERGQIELLYNQGLSPYAIGKVLGRAANTIRNELRRGTRLQIRARKKMTVYLPDAGQMTYERNRMNCRRTSKFLTCNAFIQYVEDRIYEKGHSVDSIYGRACLEGIFHPDEMVCTKTLYNYIDIGLMNIKNIDLPQKVKRSTKARRMRKHKKVYGMSISQRPEQANDRSEFGHWEIDSVIGRKTKGEATLLTITERKTRKEIIRKLPDMSATAVQEALHRLADQAGELFPQVFKSITADNGSEFSELSSFPYSDVYFAHPYTSSERGTNENHNGMIRRFIPKGTSINGYSDRAIASVQNWCNTLPRKILGYLTPDEAFENELMQLTT
jgi:IS30 family transposase